MLTKVYIKNYLLVEEGEIKFQPGFNIITGETGAGKSILIGAIATLLGERTSVNAIRAGENKAIVEGQFDLADLPRVTKYLKQQELSGPDQQLIIRREILASGRSRAFINDTPVTLDELENLAAMLVDLHGQHEHQSLLRIAEHLNFLDAYAELNQERHEVGRRFAEVEKLDQELNRLQQRQQELREKADYLKFQLDEIKRIDPQPGEKENLLAEEKRLAHSTEMLEKCTGLINSLYDREGSVVEILGHAVQVLEELQQLDEFFAPIGTDLNTALIAIDEAVKLIQSYSNRIEINPDRLEDVRSRLAEFIRLEKKYATTFDGVIAKKESIQQELAHIDSLDEKIAQIRMLRQEAIDQYCQAAGKLSEQRTISAKSLEKQIPEILAEIGMPGTTFAVSIEQEPDESSWLKWDDRSIKAFPGGIDRIEFFISANPGQPIRPLQKIASGGEISRIMLALKSVIAHIVQVPVLIFDEIDIGISGRVAQAVGKKLQKLAQTHQIICITHLPQIASAGDCHFLVEKVQHDSQTSTRIRRLKEQERELAIAQLLGGEQITESHIASARELLHHAAREPKHSK